VYQSGVGVTSIQYTMPQEITLIFGAGYVKLHTHIEVATLNSGRGYLIRKDHDAAIV
jgi:hypothetical protein